MGLVEASTLLQNDIPVRIVESIGFPSSTVHVHARLALSVWPRHLQTVFHAVL